MSSRKRKAPHQLTKKDVTGQCDKRVKLMADWSYESPKETQGWSHEINLKNQVLTLYLIVLTAIKHQYSELFEKVDKLKRGIDALPRDIKNDLSNYESIIFRYCSLEDAIKKNQLAIVDYYLTKERIAIGFREAKICGKYARVEIFTIMMRNKLNKEAVLEKNIWGMGGAIRIIEKFFFYLILSGQYGKLTQFIEEIKICSENYDRPLGKTTYNQMMLGYTSMECQGFSKTTKMMYYSRAVASGNPKIIKFIREYFNFKRKPEYKLDHTSNDILCSALFIPMMYRLFSNPDIEFVKSGAKRIMKYYSEASASMYLSKLAAIIDLYTMQELLEKRKQILKSSKNAKLFWVIGGLTQFIFKSIKSGNPQVFLETNKHIYCPLLIDPPTPKKEFKDYPIISYLDQLFSHHSCKHREPTEERDCPFIQFQNNFESIFYAILRYWQHVPEIHTKMFHDYMYKISKKDELLFSTLPSDYVAKYCPYKELLYWKGMTHRFHNRKAETINLMLSNDSIRPYVIEKKELNKFAIKHKKDMFRQSIKIENTDSYRLFMNVMEYLNKIQGFKTHGTASFSNLPLIDKTKILFELLSRVDIDIDTSLLCKFVILDLLKYNREDVFIHPGKPKKLIEKIIDWNISKERYISWLVILLKNTKQSRERITDLLINLRNQEYNDILSKKLTSMSKSEQSITLKKE